MILPFASFLEAIAAANRMTTPGSVQWLFYPGMLFGSPAKWWGDFGIRPTCHEGIDIRFFKTPGGLVNCLDAGSLIPAWDRGTILNICRDFLGYSIVIEHEKTSRTRLISAVAHIHPATGLAIGDIVNKNDWIAAIADTSKSPLAPHLHVSVMEIPLDIPCEEMNWNLFTDTDRVYLINPVFI